MASTESSGQILKTDSLARVRTPPQRRRELLEEFERSGLSGSRFAELSGVMYSTFAAWAAKRKRLAEAAPPPVVDPAAKVRWLEAEVDRAQNGASKGGSVLTVQFANGACADISNAGQAELAAAVLRAMNQPASP